MKTTSLCYYLVVAFLVVATGCEKEALDVSEAEGYDLKAKANNRALSHTKQYDADVAIAWYDLLVDLNRYTPYFNPQSTRIFAYSGLALYEAVVPGMPSYQSVFSELSGQAIAFEGKPKDYYWPASANAALAEITRKLLQDYPQPANLTAISELEAQLNQEFLQHISPEQLERSAAFGEYVAQIIYEWSRTDGTFSLCPPYVPLGEPGKWEPTPPMYFPAAGACQGDLRTFIPHIAETVMPGPPPPYSTDPASEFYQMNIEVYEITQNLTAEELLIIQAWRDIPGVNLNRPTHLLGLTADLIEREDVNLEDASVLLARQGLTVFDAIAAVFAAKFEYALIRPVTYIHEVLGYTSWQSIYPAPQHPSYPATSTGVTAAALEVLEAYFGSDYAFEDTSQEELYGVFYYDSFDEMLEAAAISRTHSGINYRSSVEVGEQLGIEVGEVHNELKFKK